MAVINLFFILFLITQGVLSFGCLPPQHQGQYLCYYAIFKSFRQTPLASLLGFALLIMHGHLSSALGCSYLHLHVLPDSPSPRPPPPPDHSSLPYLLFLLTFNSGREKGH